MYVVVARFTTDPGEADAVAELLASMIPHALDEPGCHAYIINRSIDDPAQFLLYEQYTDEDAFAAHRETEPFNRIVLGEVVPRLVDRQRELFSLVEPAG
jgi:quinol monooxygenase YgiN